MTGLSEAYATACEAHARAKVLALTAERKAKRIYDAVLVEVEGGSQAIREAKARLDANYTAAKLEADRLEYEAIISESIKDAAEIRFEAWRTDQATRRAEMNLR